LSNIVRRFDPSLIRRPISLNGSLSSEDWNDSIDELVRDLSEVSNQWNNGLLYLFSTLPDGTDDTSINAFINGIDGRTIYLNNSLVSSSASLKYFDILNNRPKTIEETVDDVYTYIDDVATTLQDDLSTSSSQLTDGQKASIGINIFDTAQSSSSVSLDGKSERSRLNIIQLASDMYGTTYSLDNDGSANLTNSVKAMVDALLELHNGNWDDDIVLSHTGLTVGSQDSVPASAVINDSFVGSPTDTEDDMNQIRTRIKNVAGTASWTTSLPNLYAAGPDSIKDLLDSTYGTGTKTSTNPWGYAYADIDGLSTVLTSLNTFTGRSSNTDSTPGYSSTNYIANSDSLETAVGKLDDRLGVLSGEVISSINKVMYEREHVITGGETSIVLSGTPITTTQSYVGAELEVYFNGVKAQYRSSIPTLSGMDLFNYNVGTKTVSFASQPLDTLIQAVYWCHS